MSRISENVIASGSVKIEKIFSVGKVLLWENKNTLTTHFFNTIPRLLAGQVGTMTGNDLRTVQSGTGLWATTMQVGKGSTPASSLDMDLEDSVQILSEDYPLPIGSVAFGTPSPGSVAFSATLPLGAGGDDFNNNPLTEVGLYSEAGLLLARQVYPAINKTTSFQLQYTWTITFRS